MCKTYSENYKIVEEIEDQINGKTSYVHGLEDLISL